MKSEYIEIVEIPSNGSLFDFRDDVMDELGYIKIED